MKSCVKQYKQKDNKDLETLAEFLLFFKYSKAEVVFKKSSKFKKV